LPSFFQKACEVDGRGALVVRRNGRNSPNELFFLLLFLWALLFPKEKVIVPGKRPEAIGDRFIWAFHVEGR